MIKHWTVILENFESTQSVHVISKISSKTVFKMYKSEKKLLENKNYHKLKSDFGL